MKKHFMLMAMFMSTAAATAQWMEFGNNGFDEFNNFIGNTDNTSLNFRTDDLTRMKLYRGQSSLINGFTVAQDGFLGISARPGFFTNATGGLGTNAVGPFSRLHLVDDVGINDPQIYAQPHSYRSWMRNGITMTGNADHGYLGQKYTTMDRTDMVLHWGNNTGPSTFAPDYLRMIFTGLFDNSQTHGARSLEGLEGMRLYPVNDTMIFVGVGDFWKASVLNGGAVVNPSEQLDVVDRTIRVRRLVPDFKNDTLHRVVVTDGNGRFHWRPANTLGSGTSGCEWTLATAPLNKNVSTAYGPPAPNCPDHMDAVGIGTDLNGVTASAKLVVVSTDFERGVDVFSGMPATQTTGVKIFASNGQKEIRGLDVDAVNNAESIDNNYGATIKASGLADKSWGVYAHTQGALVDARAGAFHSWDNANKTHGVIGSVHGGEEFSYGVRGVNLARGRHNYGVYGEAKGYMEAGDAYYGVSGIVFQKILGNEQEDVPPWIQAYGVYGAAPWNANDSMANSWAGYFQGDVKVTGDGWILNNNWQVSDSQFKTEVEEITSASEVLLALAPKQYTMMPNSHPHLRFSQGTQYGLIAQDLEDIVPSLVRSSKVPAVYDTLGTMLHEAVQFKGVNYTGLIPHLIAGYQGQQAIMDQQEEAIEALQTQVEAQNALISETQDVNDQTTQMLNEVLERVNMLEHMLALCCQAPTDPDPRSMGIEGTGATSPSDERLLRIQPNPFNERTTLYYQLEKSGRMQLMANSSDGKQLRVLHEAAMEAGQYQYEWHTQDLAPGIYYVTLLLDGEPLVKRAVKVN